MTGVLFKQISLPMSADSSCQLCDQPLNNLCYGHTAANGESLGHGFHFACVAEFFLRQKQRHIAPHCSSCYVHYANAPDDALAILKRDLPAFLTNTPQRQLSLLCSEPFFKELLKQAIEEAAADDHWPILKILLKAPLSPDDFCTNLRIAIFNAVCEGHRHMILNILLTVPNAALLFTNDPFENEYYGWAYQVANAVNDLALSNLLTSFFSPPPSPLPNYPPNYRGA